MTYYNMHTYNIYITKKLPNKCYRLLEPLRIYYCILCVNDDRNRTA